MAPTKKKAVNNQFRTTREERRRLEEVARRSGKSLSQWLREVVFAEADRQKAA